MYKFIYAKHKIHPKCEQWNEQWYLLLDNLESLHGFIQYRQRRLVKVYMDLKRRRNADGVNVSKHYSGMDENLIGLTMECREDRKTIVDDAMILDSFLETYNKVFMKEGHVLINPNMFSCRWMDETFSIVKTVSKDDMLFPDVTLTQKDIKCNQWPNGNHWYVRVGEYDLPEKYSTYKRGMEAGKKYLEYK